MVVVAGAGLGSGVDSVLKVWRFAIAALLRPVGD